MALCLTIRNETEYLQIGDIKIKLVHRTSKQTIVVIDCPRKYEISRQKMPLLNSSDNKKKAST